ncbi:MAG TPA: tRNA pseudouridine(38-40) synthase TruA [Lachnospiraceae bacterium]|nr:tRNA pseudouridine(38-40) synthase TruA [Lachnospiraceae bacterium]
MILQYEGTRYQGWQKQTATANTIQGRLEELLSKMTGEQIKLNGSGRTDAGVHAEHQVANFCTKSTMTTEEMFSYINRYLPLDIRVISMDEADLRFHSRLHAKEKVYLYRIHNDKVADVFTRRYTYQYENPLDIKAMEQAAELLCGTHDFKAFCTNKRLKKSTVRTVFYISIEKKDREIRITYHANGFLYHMVRIMTGTLIEVGNGSRTPESIPQLFNSKDREKAGMLVPGQGLTLLDVRYES